MSNTHNMFHRQQTLCLFGGHCYLLDMGLAWSFRDQTSDPPQLVISLEILFCRCSKFTILCCMGLPLCWFNLVLMSLLSTWRIPWSGIGGIETPWPWVFIVGTCISDALHIPRLAIVVGNGGVDIVWVWRRWFKLHVNVPLATWSSASFT